MKKIIAILLCLAMVLCVFAGCSAAKKDDTKKDEEKTWIIGTDTAFNPFEYTNADGKFVGIDVDILDAIAKDQGFKYELKSWGWDASITACNAGQADGMIAGASITEKRVSEGWIFSDGYYTATQCMAVAKDSSIKGFEDLKGKLVAVKTGTQGEEYAKSLQEEYGFDISNFEDSPTMYQAVQGGQCVACFEDTPIMKDSIKQMEENKNLKEEEKLKVLDDTQNEGGDYGFAIFDANNQELLDAFNAGLKNIKASGEYDQILEKYLGK